MVTRASKLKVRQACLADLPALHQLSAKVYANLGGYELGQLRGQLNHFPQGHFVALFEDQVVGYCASLRVAEARAMHQHNWRQISGGGYGSTDDPDGDWLYGYEVCVDPDYRGLRIGERLYSVRRKLCTELQLKGIVFAGRLPNFSKRKNRHLSAAQYCEAVKQRKLRDPVMSFQLRQGFECIGVLAGYLPEDQASLGYASHMVWRNPAMANSSKSGAYIPNRPASSVRIGIVQYQQRAIKSFAEFAQIVSYFVATVAHDKADFVLFPEYFALQLLSLEIDTLGPRESIIRLAEQAADIEKVFRDLAIRHNINIIAGSHPQLEADGRLLNVAHVFLRDGSVHEQAKIHPTPEERYWWQISGGDALQVIETDCGPIGVLICYDAEFPELARHLVDQGAMLLFVPFSTEERNGYLRVRYCAQARAVENQVYVAIAGNVGNLPRVQNMDIHYAQSAILTPCDFPFSRDGIAAQTTENLEQIAMADVAMDTLGQARTHGTVQNWKDRRHDLYTMRWHGRSKP